MKRLVLALVGFGVLGLATVAGADDRRRPVADFLQRAPIRTALKNAFGNVREPAKQTAPLTLPRRATDDCPNGVCPKKE